MPEPSDKTSESKRLVAEALIHANNNEVEQAFERFALAIDTDPTNAGAYWYLGILRAKCGDMDGAIAEFDKAIKLSPNNAQGYYFRGLAWDRKGNRKRANEDYSSALVHDPEHVKAKERLFRGSVIIHSTDFWVKIVEMLQQNWALIDADDAGAVRVYFVDDTGGVFDEMAFPSAEAAFEGLWHNGFRRYAGDSSLSFLRPPSAPFRREGNPIYSSGRFWR